MHLVHNGKEYDEIWDGKNDNHSIVINGVYFYRVDIGNQHQFGERSWCYDENSFLVL